MNEFWCGLGALHPSKALEHTCSRCMHEVCEPSNEHVRARLHG